MPRAGTYDSSDVVFVHPPPPPSLSPPSNALPGRDAGVDAASHGGGADRGHRTRHHGARSPATGPLLFPLCLTHRPVPSRADFSGFVGGCRVCDGSRLPVPAASAAARKEERGGGGRRGRSRRTRATVSDSRDKRHKTMSYFSTPASFLHCPLHCHHPLLLPPPSPTKNSSCRLRPPPWEPPVFMRLKTLRRSVLDMPTAKPYLFNTSANATQVPARPLPLLADILADLYLASEGADWLVYTNADIGVQVTGSRKPSKALALCARRVFGCLGGGGVRPCGEG